MIGFLTLIKWLPTIFSLLSELVKFAKEHFGDNPEKFLRDSAETFKRLREAKSTEERSDAAKAINDLIGRI